MLVDGRVVVVGEFEDGGDLGVLSLKIGLLKNLEPQEVGDGDADGFFEGVVDIEDQPLVGRLDHLGRGAADLVGEEFQVKAVGGPDGHGGGGVRRWDRGSPFFLRATGPASASFSAWWGVVRRSALGFWSWQRSARVATGTNIDPTGRVGSSSSPRIGHPTDGGGVGG